MFACAADGHHLAPSTQTQWPSLDNHSVPAAGPAANNGTSSGGDGSPVGGSGSHRKNSHNAYERGRRKELNELYSSLRSLLPGTDHTKKLSIPTTVSQALKYIPELQKQVETLEHKKEELVQESCMPAALTTTENGGAPVVSATCLDDKEIMVQVSMLSAMAEALPMSECINVLQNKGLRLVSSSTSAFENKHFYSLHLQRTHTTMSKVCPAFCDELENDIKRKGEITSIAVVDCHESKYML